MENAERSAACWSPFRLWAFRFVFVYVILYLLPFPFGVLPRTGSFARGYQAFWRALVPWVGEHVFRLSHRIVVSTACSGDTTYNYLQVLCFLALALTASVLWSVFDSSSSNYQRIHEWLRLYVRLSIGAGMLLYGAAKIFRVQFPQPNLHKLLDPLGDSSLMGLLWTFMGASRGYSLFTGCVMMLGGILLFVPRLTSLGALIGVAVFSNIFVLNLFYDVPLKLYSLHLLLLCLFLILPDAQRLVEFFSLKRSVELFPETAFLSRVSLNAGVLAAQLMLGIFLVCWYLYRAHNYENRNFGMSARPPFYGIWLVDEFTVGGKVLPPLLTEKARWRRVIFEFPYEVSIQSMNGSWLEYPLRHDMAKKSLVIEKPGDAEKELEFALSSPDPQSLQLEGTERGNEISVKLHRVDEKQSELFAGGFHWITEDAELSRDEEGVCDHVK